MIISVAYPCSNPDVLWETNVMPKCQWSPWNAVWNILDGRILKQTGRLLKTLIETVFLVRFFTRNYRSLNTASCRVVLSKGFWFNSHLGSIYIVFCWSVENREMMLYNIHVYIIRYYDICIYIYIDIYTTWAFILESFVEFSTFEVLPSTLNRWTVDRDGEPKTEKLCLQSGFFIEDWHLTEPKKKRST